MIASRRTRGGTALRIGVVVATLAILAGCGGGSSDSSGSEAGSSTEEPAGSESSGSDDSTPAEAGNGDGPPDVSEEQCEAAAPLFETLESLAYMNDELPAVRARSSAAFAELADLSEGDAAETFRDMAEEVKSDDASWFPAEAQRLLAGCAESSLEIAVSDDGLADLPSTVPQGLTALTVSNPGEETAYLVVPVSDGDEAQDVIDQVEFGGTSMEPVSFASNAGDGSLRLLVLEPGRYGVVAFTSTDMDPNATPDIAGPEFARIFEVE